MEVAIIGDSRTLQSLGPMVLLLAMRKPMICALVFWFGMLHFIFRGVIIIGRAGASPPSRTAAIIFLYIYLFIYLYIIIIYIRVVRRALNLLRASFSPIFQYFSAVNVTRVSFSPIFQYFLTCMHAVHSA